MGKGARFSVDSDIVRGLGSFERKRPARESPWSDLVSFFKSVEQKELCWNAPRREIRDRKAAVNAGDTNTRHRLCYRKNKQKLSCLVKLRQLPYVLLFFQRAACVSKQIRNVVFSYFECCVVLAFLFFFKMGVLQVLAKKLVLLSRS